MTRPLRIALVSAFPPGQQSLNEYGYHLAKGLAERADVGEVIVIADRLPQDMPELDLGPKVRVERVWSFNGFSNLPKLIASIRGARVHGVIWNLQMATFGDSEATAALGLLAPMGARLAGTTGGVIAHNMIEGVDLDQTVLKGQRLRQLAVRLGSRLITRALLSANYLTVTLRSYHDALRAKHPTSSVYLVPHGTFDTTTEDILPLVQRPRRIVTMGKFGTYKRLETLLAAFDILRAKPGNEDLELMIGGSDHPNMPGYLAEIAAQRRKDASVKFAGYIAEESIPAFFGNALLSVFDYSATTGSSGVLHQTASYGTVPVFPRIGDFVDVCEDEGITGVNYAAQNAEDMAQQMQAALDDLTRSQELVNSNREAALGFPFEKVIDFHINQLADVRGLKRVPDGQEPQCMTV
ncbi:glycosyltransferase [Yoonia sp. R78084]|uniref:glycosyltransferase n=1 Tax=Yoonia sp. R78084 TaxID=3093869 RepID=UPI0037DC9910